MPLETQNDVRFEQWHALPRFMWVTHKAHPSRATLGESLPGEIVRHLGVKLVNGWNFTWFFMLQPIKFIGVWWFQVKPYVSSSATVFNLVVKCSLSVLKSKSAVDFAIQEKSHICRLLYWWTYLLLAG